MDVSIKGRPRPPFLALLSNSRKKHISENFDVTFFPPDHFTDPRDPTSINQSIPRTEYRKNVCSLKKSEKERLPVEINFMNGAGRFPRYGIIYPAGMNWQEREPHLKGQSANFLLPAPSTSNPGPPRPPAPLPLRPSRPLRRPFPVSGGAGGEAGVRGGGGGGEVLSGFGLQFPCACDPVPSSPAPGSSPVGADDTRTSLSSVAPQLSANTELPGAVLILSERRHSL